MICEADNTLTEVFFEHAEDLLDRHLSWAHPHYARLSWHAVEGSGSDGELFAVRGVLLGAAGGCRVLNSAFHRRRTVSARRMVSQVGQVRTERIPVDGCVIVALVLLDAVILDDLGDLQQSYNEMKVLFTFLAQRYEHAA